jgi:ketosteroid isomerase-like protein
MGIPSPEVAAEIRAAEHQWMDAWLRRDLTTCAAILADEFLIVSSLGGIVADKAGWLRGAQGPMEGKAFGFDEFRLHQYGDVVVAQCLYHQEATAHGQDWGGTFRMTDVWVRRAGRWQVVSRHSTMLPRSGAPSRS